MSLWVSPPGMCAICGRVIQEKENFLIEKGSVYKGLVRWKHVHQSCKATRKKP